MPDHRHARCMSIILAAVDAGFWVRLRLRALETVAFAIVDLRTIKPERKAGVFGTVCPCLMVVSNMRRTLWVEFMLNGVEATVKMFSPLPPEVVTCRFSCEAPKERWNGMFDLGATVLSTRFLDDFSNTFQR
jgi:hypothetical protein